MNFKNLIIIITFSLCLFQAKAQSPNWTVNPSNYQHNMSFTLIMNTDFVESRDINDKIGAFINSTCVGVASPIFVNAINRFVIYLTVYNNNVSGDNISFNLYDASQNSIYNYPNTYPFVPNNSVGLTSKPVIFSVPLLSNEANLLTFKIQNQEQPSIFNSTAVSAFVNFATNLSNVTTTITTSNMAKVWFSNALNGVYNPYSTSGINFSNPVFLKLQSSDESTEKKYSVKIEFENAPPSDMSITGTNLNKSIKNGTFLGKIRTTDFNVLDTHIYTFATSTTPNDNLAFVLRRDSLFSSTSYNFLQKGEYIVTIQTDDGKFNGTFIKDFTISNLNATPTNITLTGFNLNRSIKNGTFIARVRSIDADLTDTHIHTFITSTTPNDNLAFVLRNDSLFSSDTYNFVQKGEYIITIKTDDGKFNGIFQKDITILNPNAPPNDIITLSGTNLNKSIKNDVFLAKIKSLDADLTDTHIYTLTTSSFPNDNEAFVLRNDSIFSSKTYNFLQKGEYVITIQTNDGKFNGIFVKDFLILNPNAKATNISLSGRNLNKSIKNNTFIAKVKSIDADISDIHLHTFTTSSTISNDNAAFVLRNDSLFSSETYNFVQKGEYIITIKTDDGKFNGIFQKDITILNPNITPTDITLSGRNLNKSIKNNVFIAKVKSIDADISDIHLHTFTTSSTISNDNAAFVLRNDSLFSSETYNFVQKGAYIITIKTDDGKFDGVFIKNITISNPNFKATDITLSGRNLNKSIKNNVFIAKVASIDADVTDIHLHTFTTSSTITNDNAAFVLRNDSLFSSETYNFVQKGEYIITIKTDDGKFNGIFQKDITILNPNITPTDITLSGRNLNKSIKNNTFIAKVKSIDADLTDIHVHTLTSSLTLSSNDNEAFVLRNDSLFSSETYNFVQKGEYIITIKTDDGKFNGIFQKDITILNPNITPTDITLSGRNLNKSIKNNVFIAKVKSIDADLTDIHLHTFTTSSTISNDNAAFVLRNDSLFSSETYNFVQKGEYIITIKTDDGKFNGIFQKDITILNPNITPTDITLSGANLNKSIKNNVFIAKVKSIDADLTDIHLHTFTTSSTISNDNAAFVLRNDSLFSSETYNFVQKGEYIITIKTDDGKFNGIFQKDITILNPNFKATDITLSGANLNKSVKNNVFIAKVKSIDADISDIHLHTFTTSSTISNDNAAFVLRNDSLFSSETYNFVQKGEYIITIKTDDGKFNGIFQKDITILNPNFKATDITLSGRNLNKSIKNNVFIAKVASIDADVTDIHLHTFTTSSTISNDNAAFVLRNDSLFSSETYNFVQKGEYIITIKTDDGKFNGIFQKDITILNPNITPTDITLSGRNLNKSIKNNVFIAKVKSIDADLTDIHLHTFTTSSTISNDNAAFVLRNDSLFSSETYNFVQKGEYIITIKTDDGKFNGIFQKDITILNPNFKATDITLSGRNLNKSIKNNVFIAKVGSIDADLTDIHLHTFTTSSTISNDNAAFVLRNDSLFSSETYNFVQKGEYIITIKTDDGKFNGIFQKDITILNPNETPTDILLENLTLREGNLPNTLIAILKTTDLDIEDKHIYTFATGEGSADNQDFTIKGDSLFSNITFDFETKKTFTIRLKTNDSKFNGIFEKVISLDILNFTPTKVDADNIISPTPPDGINDVWIIRNIEDFPNSKLSIFNEAGILVYTTTKYENNWDGTSNGSELPSSTYYYVLSSVEGDFTGFISIIRR